MVEAGPGTSPASLWGPWHHPHAIATPQRPSATTSGVINGAKPCDGTGSMGGTCPAGGSFHSFPGLDFQDAELKELGM